uniref:Uncharacterized protein n=1 Tax=Psilocybe cubensis TaxID=181762 RepID=A0A8H7Y3X6_PSICU
MPKTRNVTRSQWDAANTASTSGSRTRRQNVNSMAGSEKENAGPSGTRETRSQARAAGRTGLLAGSNIAVLGQITPTTNKVQADKTTAKNKTISKGKGIRPPPALKRKKQPLQDITAEFLPAQAEAANRGEEAPVHDGADGVVGSRPTETTNVVASFASPDIIAASAIPVPKFTSPLPPSSPPSAHYASPSMRPISSAPVLLDNVTFPSTHSAAQDVDEPWQDEDIGNHDSEASVGPLSSNSDPFGFVSLERKLKADREAAALLVSGHDHEEEAVVLVAETSSPRPVPRLKRSLENEEDEPSKAVEEIHDQVHYATPPTPHKDKQKRRRMSHEGHDIFSPCSSSVEPSPSPTKASARKLPTQALSNNPLDKFNEEFERSFEALKGSQLDLTTTVDPDAVSRNLRSREKPLRRLQLGREEEDRSNKLVVKSKGKSAQKPVSKSRSAAMRKRPTSKQVANIVNVHEEESEESWERARQERIEYFKRLESYEVEKEDVFLI